MALFSPASQFAGKGSRAITSYLGAWMSNPMFMPIEPWWRPGDLTEVIPGAKLETTLPVPIHKPGLQAWDGAFQFDDQSNLFLTVKRGVYTKGAKTNTFSNAEINFTSWSMTPSSMAIEIGNNPGLQLVALLNAAFTSTDQIYGGNVAVLTGGTKKHVNPAEPSIGTDWYNARENVACNADNIVAAIKNMQQRQAMNGVELGLGVEGLEVWVPYVSLEETRLLLEVFRELAAKGFLASTVDYTTNTGSANSLDPQVNQQVVFGSQTNPVFGRARVKAIHGMRSDLWCVVSPRPLAMMQTAMFLYAHGGNVGQYGITEDPNLPTNDAVPHIATYVFGEQSPMFFGIPGISKAGDIGISNLVNEGFAWASGILCEFNYTGSAS